MGGGTITFNIPGTGVQTISPLSVLPSIAQPMTIDGYTQPGSSPNSNPPTTSDNAVILIELSGAMAPPNSGFSGLTILFAVADNCAVRGLVINGFQGSAMEIASNGNVIEGNFIGTDAAGIVGLPNGFFSGTGGVIFVGASSNNTVGGTMSSARNLISGNNGEGISFGGTGNTVQNNFIGTDVTGTLPLGNGDHGVFVSGSNCLVGGTTVDARNVISANNGGGVQLSIGSDNVVQGNFIGTDVTGTIALSNHDGGVWIEDARNNIIGGLTATPGAPPGNLISGNDLFFGVILDLGGAQGNLIQGNIIGADITGTQPLGNLGGVGIFGGHPFGSGSDNTVGGTDPTARNIIAFNGTMCGPPNTQINVGVSIGGSSAFNNAVLGNSIFSNGGLGIDLSILDDGPCGVTLNGTDSYYEPNNFQYYPTISEVTIPDDNSTVELSGELDSTANTTFRLEFFSNDVADPSGFGEGKTFLGSSDVMTDGTGHATYDVTFPLVSITEKIFTATATDPSGNTSEFSPAFGTRLLNMSTRTQVLTDDEVLIGGFIVTGTGPKNVIVRGIGPSLIPFGITNALLDPILELHDATGATLTTNDDWKDSQQSEIEATGLAPSDDRESAIVMSLEPGPYTAILAGTNQTTGVGLVEVYDLDQSAGSKLANISTRGFVDTGDNVMIGGIIIGPSDTGDATVLMRAIGPSLANFGVPDALQDPVLELHDGQGTTLTSNDDWQDTQENEIEATGLAPSDPSESAILQSLVPGNYTAIVSGKNGTTGIALVEAYHLN